MRKVGRAAEAGALEGSLVELKHGAEALHDGVCGASEVEAVGDRGASSEARDTSKAKESKLALKRIRL